MRGNFVLTADRIVRSWKSAFLDRSIVLSEAM